MINKYDTFPANRSNHANISSTASPGDTGTLLKGTSQQHVDGKVKRMQAFIKKLGKARKTSEIEQEVHSSNEELTIIETPEIEEQKQGVKTQEVLLLQYEKDVKAALTYYKVILQKGFMQKLPGTATAVLESIINAETTVNTCLETLFRVKEFEPEGEKVAPLKDLMNRSITHLIRLSDDVLFDSYNHVRIDKATAFKAADAVSLSVGKLYEFVLPKIRKFSLNEELMNCGTSLHSSSNSLDDMDNIQINHNNDIDDEAFSDSYPSLPDKRPTPPPKPFLPNNNRNFYGNSGNPLLRKAISHPGEIASHTLVNLETESNNSRPLSDTNQVIGSPNRLLSENSSSRSSLSTNSNSSMGSPNRTMRSLSERIDHEDYSMKRRLESFSSKNRAAKYDINNDEIGISTEVAEKIQKYSSRYELLAKSTLSLFNEDNDDEDLLGDDNPPEGQPPALPKKTKQNADAYLAFVEGYDVIDYNGRPSSFYDNLPVPNVHTISEQDQFVQGDGLPKPKLPPKQGSYRNNKVEARNSTLSRKFRNSRRESSAVYEEDNVPALDSNDVSRLLVFKKEDSGLLLCGGTVDALIVYSAQQEKSLFYNAFVATYRTFISPTELICKLLYRANRFQDKGDSITSKAVLGLLVKVMEEMYEELDKSLFDQLRSAVHRLLNLGELKLAKNLRDKIVNYCIKLQVNPMSIYTPVKSDSELFDFKSLELAQQMCVLDADYFVKIELPEVLRWGKEQSETLSPNLSRFIGHFNNMSFWVRSLILNELSQQEREKMYKKFLKIMRILKRLNNFSSFLAILSALDSSPVRRLEWPKQYTELLAEDTKLIDSTSAFKTYRQALSEATPPCIPYLGLILTDITFIHLGNPQELPDGKVNFVKRWQQFNILDGVRRFKENLYDFTRDEKILDFINEFEDHLSEEEMWEKSQKIRPRGK